MFHISKILKLVRMDLYYEVILMNSKILKLILVLQGT